MNETIEKEHMFDYNSLISPRTSLGNSLQLRTAPDTEIAPDTDSVAGFTPYRDTPKQGLAEGKRYVRFELQ